jgi:DNA-directed RNA polymerase specialized sigma24 family protein
MSRYEGKSMKEIAKAQNISIRTAETHVSKALKMMREALDYTNQE